MCGIAAILRVQESALANVTIERLIESVSHRGPDGQHVVELSSRGDLVGGGAPWFAALGHRRLSIIDLSDAARQPMERDGVWITYNGEIYNYVELREELRALGFNIDTTSDTEVLLAAWRAWGMSCFSRLKGMWALVIVDTKKRQAIFSRDRLGIKPLYVYRESGALYAVSEIKQLAAAGLRLRADDSAVFEYLRTGHEDPARTFFAGVAALAPGTAIAFDLDSRELREQDRLVFWHPERVPITVRDETTAAALFRDRFDVAVREHLRSDVPVGCALSGGLDSTSIAMSIARTTNDALHTFTAIFPGESIDERAYAEIALKMIRATPHFVQPSPEEFLAELDRFTWIHDEPVGSLAMYAGYCIARAARQSGVPVALNGQGGDEVFSGYWQSYFLWLRQLALGGHPVTLMRQLLGSALPGGNRESLRQIPVMLARYRRRRSVPALRPRRGGTGGVDMLARALAAGPQERRVFEMRELHLPRLLKWDDRNFMAFGVEGRYPFLDHEVIEAMLSCAPEVLYRKGFTKMPLRLGLADRLPRAIAERTTKLGFETPQARWLKGPLRPTVERIVRDDGPLWEYVERADARALAADVYSSSPRGGEEASQGLMRLLLLDRWLRTFFDSNAMRAAA